MPPSRLHFLVAEGETPEARQARRDSVGESSGETYREFLSARFPDATVHLVRPGDGEDLTASPDAYDAVFLSGSPLHLFEESEPGRLQVAFMRAVFASGTPSFGSCAGLQVATVAAGGTVRPNRDGHEAGFARAITRSPDGRHHPLLAGRPDVFDAPAVHSDEVARLPDGALLLASNAMTSVQAAEITVAGGLFWGVQYHPELSLGQIAAALRRQAGPIAAGSDPPDADAVRRHADLIEALHRSPDREDLAAELRLDGEVIRPESRMREISNFVDRLVRPSHSARGRG